MLCQPLLMRKWGIIVTSIYAVAVFLLYAVGAELLAPVAKPLLKEDEVPVYVLGALILVACQVALLLVTVDHPKKRLTPRQHVRISIASVAFCLALLTLGVVYSVWAATAGDEGLDVLGWPYE